MAEAPSVADLLGPDTPSHRGKWGPEDEVGSLNVVEGTGVPVNPVVIR